MKELTAYLDNIKKDDNYQIMRVLKTSTHSQTEKVLGADQKTYIRKSFPLDFPGVKKEYDLLKGLNHPALPKVYDYYELADKGVLVEEYIEGTKLSELILFSGPLEEKRAVEIIKEICKICMYLHTLPVPVIHRDIKPDNIIYSQKGQIILIDFGAAREYKNLSTKDTVYVGTVGYAPPEQFGFGQTDARADIYGIGMSFYHLLTGRAPQRGEKAAFANSSISPDIQRIIDTATRFDPEERYSSVSDMLEELNNLVEIDQEPLMQRLKKKMLQKPNNLYPKHRNWPVITKVALMPVHLLLSLFLIVIISTDLFTVTGYGRTDDMARLLTDLVLFLFVILPPYILCFNLFDLEKKLPFFHRNKLIKKILVIVSCLVLSVFLYGMFNNLHSQAYQLAKHSAAS